MRGNIFMGSPLARTPIRPVRLAQSCPIDGPCPRPGGITTTPIDTPDDTVSPVAPTQDPAAPAQDWAPATPISEFPIVPVAVGAGALLLIGLFA